MIFCKHEWEIIKEVKHKSGLQQFKDIGLRIESASNDVAIEMMKEWTEILVKCKKCPKIKQYRM